MTLRPDRIPFRVHAMLATLVPEPFHRPGWVYEEKYDGFRILAYKEGPRVRLLSRNDNDRTATYSDIAQGVSRLVPRTLLLDGEIVAFDRRGVSRFQLLQKGTAPRAYAVFDCLYDNGRDLRRAPLTARRRALEKTVPDDGIVRRARRLEMTGLEAYRYARRRGLEGIIAKDEQSAYEEKRSSKWLKVKVRHEEEFVIGGYTAPRGARTKFGALLLGAYDAHGRLRYVGKVGTGFTRQTLDSLYSKLTPLVRSTPAFIDPPRERDAVYVTPRLVAQIAFEEWTADWKLRQPAFLGLRDDKKASEVVHPEAVP
ncbi:MAG TPA: non-homologous end-joining DNA ligase [bacterium]|nr:non-homologous end-joining DNA ligase [bacterium]